MGTSPDVGGRTGLGRPLVPQQEELEATAQTQVARQGLGMIPNTIEVVFTQLGGNIWRYDAQASKPKLPMDVLVAVTHPDPKATPTLERQIFEKLVNELPLKLSMELKRERKKPKHERDPAFVVLDQILQFAARVEAWLQELIEEKAKVREEKKSLVASFPLFMLQGWIETAGEIINQINYFSPKSGFQAFRLQENLNILLPLVKKAEEAMRTEDQKRQLQQTALLIERTRRVVLLYKQKKLPNLMGIVGKLISSLLSITSSLKYEMEAPACLHLSFGIEAMEQSQWIGPGFQTIVEQLIESIPNITGTEKMYLQSAAYFLMALYTTSVTEASGAPTQSSHSIKEQTERIRSLAFALASTFICHSEVIRLISKQLMKMIFKEQSASHEISEVMVILAFTVPIFAGAKGDEEILSIEPLLKGTKKPMQTSLETLKRALDSIEVAKVSKNYKIAMRQAVLSLERTDPKGYLEAVQMVLEEFNIPLQTLQYESEHIVSWGVNFLNSLYRSKEQEKFTSIMRQAA